MTIIKATKNHLKDLIPLFDGYRRFYKQESDLIKIKQFLSERLINKDSIIFIAYLEDKAVGFTQLYNLFSSVSMERMYLLNDLYVVTDFRGKGIGEALIDKTKAQCISENQKGIAIQTASDNPAQHLYQRLDFNPDPDLHFFWTNPK
ncbi:GNAT family N-acetyltransferase [Winogradskyella sp. PC-19]|jgi:GNAT superfamily N-acetyltransferase|uniref:GNAT family N-acetyltransferase n=1 Tax=unclassified Winogradskyella TaxID=2615021 RepID=UPI000B3C9E46|nr:MULTISPECIES: GNAT family N-acetyltransferase [unclassified Winogradskyella]ARV08107.1 GNAT family N-acetyltransferase [Winogradskyella sp. PC-19]